MQQAMESKICLITGATSGIGFITARELAAKGMTVVLVGRDPAKTKAADEHIKHETGNTQGEYLVADLSSQAEVRRLANDFKQRHSRLDVLLNNAGAMFTSQQQSADGIEMTLTLNHLAPFLLTHLLLDTLKASAPARIVVVGSDAHNGARNSFDDPQQKRRGYAGLRAYSESKLANIMFTYELARHLAGTGVTANALHPGFVASNFARNNGGLVGFGMLLLRPIMISSERGAQTSIYLASSPEGEGVTGQYFVKCKPARSSAASYDEAAQRHLWEMSEELTGLSVRA
ncbi:MAG TPA: SDR family oxidoreductase [Ktedonobacterales bacterium]|nr:SDR family oxidoreductase [Ktedonobacterales bacterium]